MTEQLKYFPIQSITNCDDYKCHKAETWKQLARELNMWIYTTKGGLTQQAQVMDCAANGMVHQHIEAQNVERMLTAPLDARRYPICMTRVKLAHSVCEGWDKVSPVTGVAQLIY